MEDARQVIRCSACNLVQYLTKNEKCRRCQTVFERQSFKVPDRPAIEELTDRQKTIELLKEYQPKRETLGDKLRNWREIKNITQGQFVTMARQTGWTLSRSYLSRFESGAMTFSLSYIERSIALLELTPHEFFDLDYDWFLEALIQLVPYVEVKYKEVILDSIKSLASKETIVEHNEEVFDLQSLYGIRGNFIAQGRPRKNFDVGARI